MQFRHDESFSRVFLRLTVEPSPAFVAFDKHDFVLVSTANELMNKVCVQCNAVMQSLSRHLFESTAWIEIGRMPICVHHGCQVAAGKIVSV